MVASLSVLISCFLFLVAWGLGCFIAGCRERGLLSIAVQGLPLVVALEHGLEGMRASRVVVQGLRCVPTWDLPRLNLCSVHWQVDSYLSTTREVLSVLPAHRS